MLQLELLRRLSRVHLSFTKSEVKRLKKAVSLNSRCVGTLGMEQSLPGNMKTNSEEFPHLFFEPVLRSNCRNLSLEGHGLHLTGRTVHPYLDQCTDITHAKHIDQTTALLTENENLKAQIHENLKCITMDSVKPRVLATGRYATDVEPIPPRNRNNREMHLDYLKHLKESVETLREIVEEAKIERPLDGSLAFA
ncbi:hypothetical protein Tco_0576472 [Tanacetum coccineum]